MTGADFASFGSYLAACIPAFALGFFLGGWVVTLCVMMRNATREVDSARREEAAELRRYARQNECELCEGRGGWPCSNFGYESCPLCGGSGVRRTRL